jgi:cytochrome c5
MRHLLAPALLALAACSHGGGGAAPAPPDGATLYRRSCASCHRLLSPTEHDAATWRRAVERFGARLPARDREEIVRHLTDAGTAPRAR